jgi:putative transposase
MRRSYKFLLRPTSRQVAALEACLEDHRQLYNAALEERREAWRMRKVSVLYNAQDLQLKFVRYGDPDGQGRWSYCSQQATLRRLDRAFAGFFRRVKAGEAPGYPRFKSPWRFNSVTWRELDGARWDATPHDQGTTRVRLQGIGCIRVNQHRAVRGRVKTITVKREGKRWYVMLSCDGVPAEPLPTTGATVGIDMGLTHFLTTSGGEHVTNPRPRAGSAGRIADAQRALFTQKPRSMRRRKAAAKVAGLHAKVRRQRLDHAHKTALTLVRDHDVIVHEALRISNMTRRPDPRLADDGTYESNGASAKAGLNKSIKDAGWGVFLAILRAKAESAGRAVVAVNPANTSRRCAQCGHVAAGNRVNQAEFRCLACGHQANADVNAAMNILRAGLALQAAQAA